MAGFAVRHLFMRKLAVLLFLLFAATNVFAQNSSRGEARQLILVTTPDWNSVQGKLQRFERKKAKGKWQKMGEVMPVVVGKSGLAWGEGLHEASVYQPNQPIKREGDGKSPAGIFKLTSAFGTIAVGGTTSLKIPYTPIVESTECVDDVKSGKYNTIVDRYKVSFLDWKSSEKMLSVGEQYALGVFVAHNSDPVQKGMGSCIFLHIWKNSQTGTAGCTAMPEENMSAILQWLDAKADPILVQLPIKEFNRLRKSWKLPKNN
jgi:D-alanyl-D-alanine dipeptidase